MPPVRGGCVVYPIEQKQWIRSPGFDLFFFCALWWLPLSLLLFGATPTAGTALVFLLYHLFIRVPHFAATLNFTYLYKENREYYRGNWVKYFAVPILILVAYGARPWFAPESLYNSVLVTIATVWGMQHIGLQNYGILSIYRGRSAARADTLLPKLERAVFYELIALAVFLDVFRLFLPNVGLESVDRSVTWGLRGLFALTCAVYFARIWTRRKITPVSLPGLLYFITAVSVMIHWPVYNEWGGAAGGGIIFFYVFNGQHCLAYLGLLFHMTSNKQRSQREFSSVTEGGFEFAKFYAPLAIGAAALLAVAVFRYSQIVGLLPPDIPSGFQAIAMLDGIFVTHYYIEAFTWKFSNPHNRAVILPLLKQPQPALAEGTRT
jgi:hypothetical protein